MRSDWIDDAACKSKDPAEWDNETEYAYHICTTCPVMLTCREDAMTDNQSIGTRGGLTTTQRTALHRRGRYRLELYQRQINRTGERITPEEDALRRQLHTEGRSDAQIARMLGSTPEAIYNWRRRRHLGPNGSSRHKLTDRENQQIRAAWESGLTDEQIGAATSRTPGAIGAWRRRNDLKPNPKKAA